MREGDPQHGNDQSGQPSQREIMEPANALHIYYLGGWNPGEFTNSSKQANDSITRVIAGWVRFFTLTQSFDRPPR
jgi:hypothetical protein